MKDKKQDPGSAPILDWSGKASAYFPLGLHISQQAWDTYGLDALFASALEMKPAATQIVYELAHRMNAVKSATQKPGEPVRAGHLLAAGLFEDILRYVADTYCLDQNPGALCRALSTIEENRGAALVDEPVETFEDLFPPQLVRVDKKPIEQFHREAAETGPLRHGVAREFVLLWLVASNPAVEPEHDLFDDAELRARTPYEALLTSLKEFFAEQPPVMPLGQSLLECLQAPILASPHSLEGQLDYVRSHWAGLLPPDLLRRLLLVEDVLKEETLMRGFGPGSIEVLRFGKDRPGALGEGYPEPERFSEDKDWMSNVVLIAKSTHVWLDQLSKKYERDIHRLDEIPDEELDLLARWGFTGLWLIGVWERSCASQQIKQMMGNPEAAASAYSIYDYTVAWELGGEEAVANLRERAWRRGIRLACDMVPNHVGIFSKWLIEHPDWFIQLPHPPYPAYSFTGPDLSPDDRVSVYIDDGYWERRDAAVVFKRVDNETGDTRYIYHGNDGTNMPWNDTAQLNYLMPEVRQAVAEAILHVARQFPIIRFDAAMTLSKRHYQRLWFPKPGDGGAIPSRAEQGMDRGQFDDQMPVEFWRDVVDRVSAEVPDTLLLAEAFWLMEGYFVRTLGMHRVYNSAFMNMLKMEENSKYRATVRNVLEFSPEVLKRFVNFMNNPDELTAVEQFGKGDKYFGVAVLMVTMPGLPMFGHGQVEGFAEKYGMEYRRAYWDETVDTDVVSRHEAEIFPLMRKRYLFSGAANFAFYDFVTPEGHVDENVFAYSNRAHGERGIILYNNAYNTTSGHISLSTSINTASGTETHLVRRPLAEALELKTGDGDFYVFRNYRTGQEYLRSGRELAERGLGVNLAGYEYAAFLDFREVKDLDGSWARLACRLAGAPVPDMGRAYREVLLAPVLDAFRLVLNAEILKGVAPPRAKGAEPSREHGRLVAALHDCLARLREHTANPFDAEAVRRAVLDAVDDVQNFEARLTDLQEDEFVSEWLASPLHPAQEGAGPCPWIPLLWALVHPLGRVFTESKVEAQSALWMEEWMLDQVIAETLTDLGREDWQARLDADLITILIRYIDLPAVQTASERGAILRNAFEDPVVRSYLYINQFEDALWLNKEQFEKMMHWLYYCSAVRLLADPALIRESLGETIVARYHQTREILAATENVNYQVGALLELLA